MLNLPNILTILRILLVPILVVVLLTKFNGKEHVGLAVFLLAALTDFLDGYIARRWGLVTRLGKLL
ncbi:MAG: CDP-alcohol phosphatidyltransferase family protein, partial [Acidobacteriota bacterium]